MSDERKQQNQQSGGEQKPGQQQRQQWNQKPGVAPEYEEQEGDQAEGGGSESGAHVPDPNTRGV
jgi:hypothetical protein